MPTDYPADYTTDQPVGYSVKINAVKAAAKSHTDELEANLGTVAHGGTGLTSVAAGSFLRGNGVGALIVRTAAQVLSDIGAAAAGHTHPASDIIVGATNVALSAVLTAASSTTKTTLRAADGGTDTTLYVDGTNNLVGITGNSGTAHLYAPSGDFQVTAESGDVLVQATQGALTLESGDNKNIDIESGLHVVSQSIFADTTTTSANMNISSVGVIRFSTSVRAHKKHIEDLDPKKFDVLAMRPRAWYDKEQLKSAGLDPENFTDEQASEKGLRRIGGFVAEEMAEAAPLFVPLDEKGKPQGVDYDRVVAAVVAEFQSAVKRIDALEKRIADLEKARA